MKTDEFLKKLESYRAPIFSFSELVKVLGKHESYAKVFLNRAVEKKLLIKIGRGKYGLPNQNPFSVASNLVFPSYVSLISAYSFYSLTTQLPIKLFVVGLKQKREVSYMGYKIKFIAIGKKRFFGYKKEFLNGKVLFVAEIEKAILDSLFLPVYCPISETFFALREAKIDKDKLLEYVKRFDSKIVAKRLGYLLELNGVDLYNELRNFVRKNYELLNPIKFGAKEKDKKWKLIINEVFE